MVIYYQARIMNSLRQLSTSARKLKSQTNFSIAGQQPDLKHFIKMNAMNEIGLATKRPQAGVHKQTEPLCSCDNPDVLSKCSRSSKCQHRVNQTPVLITTHGCEMNVNDTAIVKSILQDYGYRVVENESEAEIQLLMTCAIRESAEAKIWSKLRRLRKLKASPDHALKQVGILGCMAERLKTKLLEPDVAADIVAGPDSYRDLPRLFSVNRLSQEKAINCLLSFDETYSDIRPVTKMNEVRAMISITRGCDNLCSFCIVPFTRGHERSRPMATILQEVRELMDRGIKEVTLLGQNVNSYRDLSTKPKDVDRPDLAQKIGQKERPAEGFRTVYKPRVRGLTFDVLLEEVAKISPELRVRFTSPHPKDFTDDVIAVMRRYPNVARNIHLPAQSGSNKVLANMRRGYTRESYLDLVHKLRSAMPELTLTSDFITGFCGETREDHEETVDLIKRVNYSFVYVFPYSQRDKTSAYHNLKDTVEQETKVERVKEIMSLFRERAARLHESLLGQSLLALVESDSARSSQHWKARAGNNLRIIIDKKVCLDRETGKERPIEVGDYVACRIFETGVQTLKAEPEYITSQGRYHEFT